MNDVEGTVGIAHYVAVEYGVFRLIRSAALGLSPYDNRRNAVLPDIVGSAINE